MSEQYVLCEAGRTITSENCTQGVFNPRTKQCGLIVSEGEKLNEMQEERTIIEPRHEKTGFVHMRKQRRRSASR